VKIPTATIIALFLVIGTAFAVDYQPTNVDKIRCAFNPDFCFEPNMRNDSLIIGVIGIGLVIGIYSLANSRGTKTLLRSKKDPKDKKIVWRK